MNPEAERKQGAKNSVKEWIKTIVIALAIALPIRIFIAEPFIVSGASMDPTFASNQFLIVDRLSYRFHEPERGDVIVFKYPNNPKVYYIKRIIGLPGETISLKNGVISITPTTSASSTITLDEPYIESTHKSFDNLITTLGPEEYFVMGDNRLQSSDSRVWGPLSTNLIVGKPLIRLLPINELSLYPGKYHANNN